jgi:anti-anti-sigma factor
MSLPLSVVALPGGVVQIGPRGEIDLDNAYELRDTVTAVLAASHPVEIRVDLGQVSFIDSVGIGALVSGFHAAAACGVRMVAVAPRPTVHRQLWVCGVAGLFGLPTSAPAACGGQVPAGTGDHRTDAAASQFATASGRGT